MKLALNKNKFVESILGPVSKLSENLLLDFVTKDTATVAKTLVPSADNSVILMANVDCQAIDPIKCVIPDCKTFLRLFSGIDKENISLLIDSNAVVYKDTELSFKYHLLDESYMVNKKSISEEKLNNLKFDTTFQITKQKFSEIIKFNSIVPDAEKLYFITDKGKVFAKIGDEQKTNTNEITTEVSHAFEGAELSNSIPVNIQNILLFSFSTNQITIHINHQLKVLKFESPNLTYIVSGLVR